MSPSTPTAILPDVPVSAADNNGGVSAVQRRQQQQPHPQEPSSPTRLTAAGTVPVATTPTTAATTTATTAAKTTTTQTTTKGKQRSSSPAAAATCTIVYSTQTGRAKACARRTARILGEKTTLKLLGGKTFDEINFVEYASTLAPKSGNHFFLFFVSTTGDGVHCDTIQSTWRTLLQKSLPPFPKAHKFALFSLGDRAYGPQFCAAGRKLAVRLQQLGMTCQGEIGYGDDNTPNGGCFADLDAWIDQRLLPSLKDVDMMKDSTTSLSLQQQDQPLVNTSSHYKITLRDETETDPEWNQAWCQYAYQSFFAQQRPLTAYHYTLSQNDNLQNAPQTAVVECNLGLTAEDWEQNTRHLRLRVETNADAHNASGLAMTYQAGDIATILPSNPPDEVERFLKTLPEALQQISDHILDLDYMHQESNDNEAQFGNAFPHWPKNCTLRGWLTYCADIHAPPEREDLRAMAPFCSQSHEMGSMQSEKLMSLSETSESSLYVDYIIREKRCWTDVFYDFDSLRDSSTKLSLEALLTLLPPIRPRDFSIASSPTQERLKEQQEQHSTTKNNGDSASSSSSSFAIELCVAVVEGTTPLGKKKYHGLCSHYLSELTKGRQVRLWIRPGSFAGLPLDPAVSAVRTNQWFDNPVLYIGAGTGVAPLRGLFLEREARRRQSQSPSLTTSPATSTNLEEFDNILIFGCRKRDMDYYYQNEWDHFQKEGRLFVLPAFSREQARKVYVQQLIKQNGDAIVKHVLENNGAIYIAGNPSVARYSKEELVEATARAVFGGDEKKANLLFKKLQMKGRFSVEAW